MANPKSVDPSLWWDPFSSLLTEIEKASPSDSLPQPIAKKLEENHAWFVGTLSMFKAPNVKSKEALNSDVVKIKEHQLVIKPELKEKALRISSYLNLDEIQSYILAERSAEQEYGTTESVGQEFIDVILLQYYIERQCLLKCTKRILIHALYAAIEEDVKLISDGLEGQQSSVLENLMSSCFPQQMDVNLFTLWAEERLIEYNLVLDVLFLLYHESFSICSGERWIKLCSFYKGILLGSYNISKLVVSAEAQQSVCRVKIQLLMILIETLDMENLLQMVHDGVPLRSGTCVFSMNDIQKMDATISSLNTFEVKEAGPLVLAWAVFLCLISSLPGKEESPFLMEIDHVSYVHQAFEAASLSYFLEVLQSNILNDFDGSLSSYRSVLRTFISAFIASYEINFQLEDATLELILEILCKVYRGEESLCSQFWDRKSFVDGPIRCLLFDLESEFPFRSAELFRLLSSLSEGSWPAECVYNFLDKSVGMTTIFDITSDSSTDDVSLVETSQALHIPGLEGLVIPSNTRGRILRIISENTGLVRWEYSLSGIIVLIIRLANGLYNGNNLEAFVTLELLHRMVTFNKAVCFSLLNISHVFYVHESYLNGKMESDVRVVDIICNSVRSMTFDSSGAAVMAMAIDILAKLLQCSPSNVTPMVLKANIFDMTSSSGVTDSGYNISLSGSWSLSGKLAKMILIDCEMNDTSCPLVISVLEFTMQLVEGGLENDLVFALVVFSLQYIFASHEYWKYNHGNMRWKVTLKAVEVMKTCLRFSKFSIKLRDVLFDILLNDASVHSALFRVICTTKQVLENLCVSRFIEPTEIEGWQFAIVSVLDVLNVTLAQLSESSHSGLVVLHQAMLSSTTKPIPVVAAIVSLISFFRNPSIQVNAVKVLSKLFALPESSQLYIKSNTGFGLDNKQIADLRNSVSTIILDISGQNEDLVVAILKLLTVAARYQPALLVAIFDSDEDSDTGNLQSGKDTSSGSDWNCKSRLLHTILQYVERATEFFDRHTDILLSLLGFLKTLWQEAGQFAKMLGPFKASKKLWQQFSNIISQASKLKDSTIGNLGKEEITKLFVKYQCQSSVLEIMACNMFLYKKLLLADSLKKPCVEHKEKTNNAVSPPKLSMTADSDPNDIFSKWCDISVLDGLIQSVSSLDSEREINSQAKVAAVLLIVHLIVKLETSDTGALSMVLVGNIKHISEILCAQPAFSVLLAQYSKLGYSGGKALMPMIFSDLYCHLQGRLDGRDIPTGPFKELFQFLAESSFWERFKQNTNEDENMALGDTLLDIQQIRTELGIDNWDFSEWKTSKTTAEEMLSYMQSANSMVLLSTSQLSVLHALISVLILYEDNTLEENVAVGRKVPSRVILSSIDEVCRKFCSTVDSLSSLWDAPKIVFDILAAQADLLTCLLKTAKKNLSLSCCALVLKNVGPSLKILGSLRHSNAILKKTINLMLEVLLLVVDFGSDRSNSSGVGYMMPEKDFAEITDATIGLLPLLCDFMGNPEYMTLCLTTVDLILRFFLTLETWFPIIQSHLRLQHVILQLQDEKSTTSISTILKFFLTIAQVHGGAQMLLNSGFFSTLRALFFDFPDGMSTLVFDNEKGSLLEKSERPQHIWGISLAVVTAMVHSLGSVSVGADVVESVISYFFSEKGYMISYHLAAPDFLPDDSDKVRSRAQRTWTSVAYLRETENTLLLMCALASHWRSWVKIMKEMDSPLRERAIHLLAFISKGAQRLRESPNKTSHLLCPPVVKEEFDSCKRPSVINSKHGWFALAPLVCVRKPKIDAVSMSTALVTTGHTTDHPGPVPQSQFSDSVGMQIYRVAYLLLKFLCLQAEGVVSRAEEVGYVDLAQFPELPEPEILHGLQDQGTAIVTELCDNHKSKEVPEEVNKLCLLLIQMIEKSLYLELCVVQICRIHPVFGRVDNFSKDFKKLVKASEVHAYLEPSMESLKKIAVCLYPGLL